MPSCPGKLGGRYSRSAGTGRPLTPPSRRGSMPCAGIYLLFDLEPYTGRLRRALMRERKWYFLDWSHVPPEAARPSLPTRDRPPTGLAR
jgi:hypothetical protein